MSQLPVLTTNNDFTVRAVLTGLLDEDEQFRISPAAVVRARVKSVDGETAYTAWVTLVKDNNRDDDWGLSTLDVRIPASELGAIDQSSAKLDIEIAGNYVARDGTVSADSYTKVWTALLTVEVGLA